MMHIIVLTVSRSSGLLIAKYQQRYSMDTMFELSKPNALYWYSIEVDVQGRYNIWCRDCEDHHT